MEFSMGSVLFIVLVFAVVFIFKTINVVPQQHAWWLNDWEISRHIATRLEYRVAFIDRIAYKHVLKEIRSMCRRRCA